MQWLIFWKDNARLGSVRFTPERLAYMRERFCLSLIKRDDTGTEHWEVLAPKRKRKNRVACWTS